MSFKIVDLMVDLLPEEELSMAAPGCTATSCRAAATKEGPGVRRPGRPRPEGAVVLGALRDQLRRSLDLAQA